MYLWILLLKRWEKLCMNVGLQAFSFPDMEWKKLTDNPTFYHFPKKDCEVNIMLFILDT